MSRFCKTCGSELGNDTRFCHKCGTECDDGTVSVQTSEKRNKSSVSDNKLEQVGSKTEAYERELDFLENDKKIEEKEGNEIETKEKLVEQGGNKLKFIVSLIALVWLVHTIWNNSFDPRNTPSAAVALNCAESEIGASMKASDMSFEVVDAKDDIKFIIRCKVENKELVDIFVKEFGSDEFYYGYEEGNGGTYFRWVDMDKAKLKEDMDW